MSDPQLRLVGCSDHDRSTSAERGGDESADFVEKMAIVRMELRRMRSAACGNGRVRRERRKEEPSRERMIDRTGQVRVHPRFRDVALSSGSDRGRDMFVCLMHAQEHDLRARATSSELVKDLVAIERRHRDVCDNDIGVEPKGPLHRLPTVAYGGAGCKGGG